MSRVLEVCAVDMTVKYLLLPLIDKLEKEGYTVEIACSRGEKAKTLEKKGYVFKFVNIDRKVSLILNIKSIIELYRIIKKGKYDIVHVHTPAASVMGRVAAKLAGVPVIIYTAHGFYFHEGMSRVKYNTILKIEKYLAKYFTDFIFTQSEEDRKTALENNFIDKSKILTIGNGVDVQGSFNPINIEKDKINELYKEFNLERNDKIITFVGRFVKEKGILDLLEAFNNINFNDETKVKLLMVGGIAQSERDKDTIKKLEKYRDNPNVIFTGHRNDINSILYITDVFCLPSYREGMPRSIIEAMAMECAVIVTDIRGSREEVIDGKSGFLVPVNSINILSNKIKELIEDDKLLQEMKIAGRRRAEKLYDENEVVKKQLEIFNKLLNPKKKILFIATVEDHLTCFHIPYIKYLQGKGYEVYASTKLGKRKGELEQYGIICHDVNFSRLASPLASLRALMQVIKLMKRNQFSLVHVHTPMAAFLGRLAAKVANIKSVLYTAHGFHFYKGAPWYYWACIYPIEYLVARWTDGLIVVNQEDYINAQKMGLKPNKNLFFVQGVGVDLKQVVDYSLSKNNIKDELGLDDKDIIISCVAEFTPNKNQMFLLGAWEKIAQEFNNVYLLFIGEGSCLNNLIKYVKQNSLPRVYFLGYRNDVPKILLKSDIFVLVSKREGLPRSIMEAMALGKPMVATNIRGNRELVEHRKNGFLVELGDIDGLVSSMKKLIIDDKLRANMGKVSLEKVKNYSLEKILVRMSSIYDYFLEKE